MAISLFYTCVPKIMIRSCKVLEIWCATDGWRDERKKWHIEVGVPPKEKSVFTKKKLWNESKEEFLNLWLLQRITLYQRRWKIAYLDTMAFLNTHVCINKPYWQSCGIILFLCKYYIVISNTQILVARCNIIRASWETKKERLSYRKKYIEAFVWGILLFWLHGVHPMSFSSLYFVYSFPLHKSSIC